MSHLAEEYAKACGVKMGEPVINPHYFPILHDKYITIHNDKKVQAKEYKHDLTSELKWLVTHGLLHLLGWDHPNEQSLKQMLNCQEKLLSIESNVQHHSKKID